MPAISYASHPFLWHSVKQKGMENIRYVHPVPLLHLERGGENGELGSQCFLDADADAGQVSIKKKTSPMTAFLCPTNQPSICKPVSLFILLFLVLPNVCPVLLIG